MFLIIGHTCTVLYQYAASQQELASIVGAPPPPNPAQHGLHAFSTMCYTGSDYTCWMKGLGRRLQLGMCMLCGACCPGPPSLWHAAFSTHSDNYHYFLCTYYHLRCMYVCPTFGLRCITLFLVACVVLYKYCVAHSIITVYSTTKPQSLIIFTMRKAKRGIIFTHSVLSVMSFRLSATSRFFLVFLCRSWLFVL